MSEATLAIETDETLQGMIDDMFTKAGIPTRRVTTFTNGRRDKFVLGIPTRDRDEAHAIARAMMVHPKLAVRVLTDGGRSVVIFHVAH